MPPACSAELRNYLEIGMGVATRLSPGAEDVRIEVRCPFMRMKGCLPVVRRRAHVNCALNERRTLSEHSWFSLSERQRIPRMNYEETIEWFQAETKRLSEFVAP